MTAHHDNELEVVLVSMPFGPLRLPSIGLELLRGSLDACRSRVCYFTIEFAQRIGPDLYDDATGRFFYDRVLMGEWIFSAALNGDALAGQADQDDGAFFEEVALRETARDVPESKLDEILQVREQVDAFLADCQRQILADRPRIVGFTSTFQQHVASLALARRLKAEDPELFIVFGGANCEGVMGLETVRSFPFVDAAVSGEGEVVFPALVERILSDRCVDDLQGVYTRDNVGRFDTRRPPDAPRVPDLDALPYPDYGDFFAAWQEAALEVDKPPKLLFETSRGCWWGERQHCTFCGLNGNSMAFRSKTPERALHELKALVERYPGRRVFVVDNILDMGYFRSFLPALAAAKLDVELIYEVKANLRKDQVQLLRDAGVRNIIAGIESLSDSVLKLMRKGVRGLQNVQLLKWGAEVGVWPTWYLLWGFPGEPPEEYARMAEWIPLLTHLPPPAHTVQIQLHRFSPNFERAEELGFTDVEPYSAYRHIYRLPPEALRNLAYTFDYGYKEQQDVAGYPRRLSEQVHKWQEVFAKSELFYVEKDDELWLWDLRPVAVRPLNVLAGPAKTCYLACDRIRSISSLASLSGQNAGGNGNGSRLSTEEVEEVIRPLVEQGLMLRDGDRVLSLATAGQKRPAAEAATR